MRPRSSILLIAICLFAVAGCDQGTTVSVKNDSDRTFVAQVGADALLIVPPKQHLTVAVIGFKATVPEVQLLGADPRAGRQAPPRRRHFTINGSGTVTFRTRSRVRVRSRGHPVSAPAPSPFLTRPVPVPSDPGPS